MSISTLYSTAHDATWRYLQITRLKRHPKQGVFDEKGWRFHPVQWAIDSLHSKNMDDQNNVSQRLRHKYSYKILMANLHD